MGISLWKSILFFLVILVCGIFLFPSQRQIGLVYTQAKKFAFAVPYLQQQYQKEPQDFFNTERYLTALLQQGDFKKFEQVARQMEKQSPRNLALLELLAEFYEGQMQDDQASRYWEKLLILRPGDQALKDKLVVYYTNYKRHNALIDFYQRELPLQKTPEMYYALAQLYNAKKDMKAVEQIYWAILKKFPGEESAKRKLADLYEHEGQDDKAIFLLSQLYAENAKEPDYAQRLVLKLLDKKDKQKTIEVLEEITKRFAGQDRMLLLAGEAFLKVGDRARAQQVLKQIDQRNPQSPYLGKVGELYFQMEKFDEAKEIFRRFHEQTGGTYHSHHILGDIFAAVGDAESSRREYERALELIQR